MSDPDDFDLQTISRAQLSTLSAVHDFKVPIASPEDVIILKLEWFRLEGELSERQWNDVSRLVKLFGNTMNIDYLNQAADEVGVVDLLHQLMKTS